MANRIVERLKVVPSSSTGYHRALGSIVTQNECSFAALVHRAISQRPSVEMHQYRMSELVCMSLYVCVCVWVCACACVCVFMCACLCMCMCMCMCVCVYVCMYMYMHMYVYVYVGMYVYVCMYVYMCICIVCVYVCMYMCMYHIYIFLEFQQFLLYIITLNVFYQNEIFLHLEFLNIGVTFMLFTFCQIFKDINENLTFSQSGCCY